MLELYKHDHTGAGIECDGVKYIISGGCVYDERGKQVDAAAFLEALEGAARLGTPGVGTPGVGTPLYAEVFLLDDNKVAVKVGEVTMMVDHDNVGKVKGGWKYETMLSALLHSELPVWDSEWLFWYWDGQNGNRIPLELSGKRLYLNDPRQRKFRVHRYSEVPTEAYGRRLCDYLRKAASSSTCDALASVAVKAFEYAHPDGRMFLAIDETPYRFTDKTWWHWWDNAEVDFGLELYKTLREKSRLPDERDRFTEPQEGALVVELLERKPGYDSVTLRIGDERYEYIIGNPRPDIGLELYRLLKPAGDTIKSVCVEWDDATHYPGHRSAATLDECQPLRMTTTGWLVGETETVVLVAQTVSSAKVSDILAIPQSAIVKMEVDE